MQLRSEINLLRATGESHTVEVIKDEPKPGIDTFAALIWFHIYNIIYVILCSHLK